MEQMKRNGRRKGPPKYSNHQEAWDSGSRAFRDEDDQLLVITDEGWLAEDHLHYSKWYCTYPVSPIPDDEQVVIRHLTD